VRDEAVSGTEPSPGTLSPLGYHSAKVMRRHPGIALKGERRDCRDAGDGGVWRAPEQGRGGV